MNKLSRILFAAVAVWMVLPMMAAKPKYKNFKVSACYHTNYTFIVKCLLCVLKK